MDVAAGVFGVQLSFDFHGVLGHLGEAGWAKPVDTADTIVQGLELGSGHDGTNIVTVTVDRSGGRRTTSETFEFSGFRCVVHGDDSISRPTNFNEFL